MGHKTLLLVAKLSDSPTCCWQQGGGGPGAGGCIPFPWHVALGLRRSRGGGGGLGGAGLLVEGFACVRDSKVPFFATKQPCKNLAPCPAHLCCRWSPRGTEIPRKGKVMCLEGRKKVLFFSFCGWSSTGEAGECSVTLGVAFTAGLLWGRGAHSPESQVELIPKSDSSTRGAGGPSAKSTANPSWNARGWKCSGGALWKMNSPKRFTALGDGDAQSLPGFPRDSRGGGAGAVSTHKHLAGCIPPCYFRQKLDPLAFVFFDWRPEEVCRRERWWGRNLNLGLRDPY